MSKTARFARLALFLIAGFALTYYLLTRSGSLESTVDSIFTAVKGSNLKWLSAAFLLFCLSQLIRSWRWQQLSHRHQITMGKAIPVTAIHVGLGHILPVRLSDVALVGLFRKYSAVPAGSGAATVLLAKIMDVISMGSVVAFSFLTGLSGPVIILAALVAFTGLLCLFFLPWLLGLFLHPLRKLAGEGRVHSAWQEMVETSRITRERRVSVSKAMGASIIGWTVKLFMFYSLLQAIGVTGLPVWQIFTAGALTDLTLALPIHGLLSLGTVEAGWVAGFALTGITGELPGGLSVVEAGFSIHLLWLSMAILLMLAGSLRLLLSNGRKTA